MHNAIVWQDTRTGRLCRELEGAVGQNRFLDSCGLPLAAYFSGPKIRWLLDEVPGLRERAQAGEVLFGTVDSWLIWNLTGGVDGGVHVTDVTNASRTMLMNLHSLDWDDQTLQIMEVPRAMLPEIRSSAEVYGTARGVLEGVPVAAALGDQQAALFGQCCFDQGDAKNTYGTGSFLLLNTGESTVASKHGLLTTVGYKIGESAAAYALEGAIVGLTRFVHKGHLARAALEATAWQTREIVDAMNADAGVVLSCLKVDGGMTANDLLMQIQSDVLDVPVVRPRVAETTALGAAYAAGLAVGYWADVAELRANWQVGARWEPRMEAGVRDREYAQWQKAVERTFGWVDPESGS